MNKIVNKVDLNKIELYEGCHSEENAMSNNKRCAMEWVSYLAGERHGDSPRCASPNITTLVVYTNDNLSHTNRNRLLKPLLTKLIGTRNYRLERRRTYALLNYILKNVAPVLFGKTFPKVGKLITNANELKKFRLGIHNSVDGKEMSSYFYDALDAICMGETNQKVISDLANLFECSPTALLAVGAIKAMLRVKETN
jgi:hypothetical protein